MKRGLLVAALLAVLSHAPAALAQCQAGVASAPYIGAADMRRIARAASRLPRAKVRMQESVGAAVPRAVKRAAVPGPVKKVLPQYAYAGYTAFRIDGMLAIANGRNTLSYLLPLRGTQAPGNCP